MLVIMETKIIFYGLFFRIGEIFMYGSWDGIMYRYLALILLVVCCCGCRLFLELLPQRARPSMDIKITMFAQPTDRGNTYEVSYYPTSGIRESETLRKLSLLHCGKIESGEVIIEADGTYCLKLILLDSANISWMGDIRRVHTDKLALLVDGFLFAKIDIPYHNPEERSLLIKGEWVDPELLEQVVELIPENRKRYR